MGSEDEFHGMKIVMLPFAAPGHMIPIVDFANILATNFPGINVTFVTTPANGAIIRNSAKKDIAIRLVDFPSGAVGLPDGVENFGFITSPDMRPKLHQAHFMLESPTKDLIREIKPDCIISDMFYTWSSDFAAEIGVPRYVFEISSIFAICCSHSIKTHAPQLRVDSDAGGVVSIPSLPDEISMLKSQICQWDIGEHVFAQFFDMIREAERKSQGIVANTFQEMEGDYIDHHSSILGLKIWPIGPLFVWGACEADDSNKAQRGRNNGQTSWADCFQWLDQKKPKSVLYVSFGSLTQFPAQQLKEIAAGLEDSGHEFLWVVRRDKRDKEEAADDEWLPEGFRERISKTHQGFIIEDWAPQLLILEHQSIGGMVTHCGWNALHEGINAELPLITWPLFAEQFYHERLVVDVLKIGMAVGVTMWCDIDEVGQKELVTRDKITAAVKAVMGEGEQSADMRRRVAKLKRAAKGAVEQGGSSHANLVAFVKEIKEKKVTKGC